MRQHSLPGGSPVQVGHGSGHHGGHWANARQFLGPQAQGVLGQEHQVGLRARRHRPGSVDAGRQRLLGRQALIRRSH